MKLSVLYFPGRDVHVRTGPHFTGAGEATYNWEKARVVKVGRKYVTVALHADRSTVQVLPEALRTVAP